MASVILATSGYDHTIRFWQAPSGICHRILQYADSQVNRLEITPDKKYLAAAGNPHVRRFEINTTTPNAINSYEGHTNNVTALGFQSDGDHLMFTASEDGTVKLWDMRTPTFQKEYECRAPVNTATLHSNQEELVTGDQNGNIRVWDLRADACSSEYAPTPDVAIRWVSVGADGSVAVAANNAGELFVWRPGPSSVSSRLILGPPLHTFNPHATYVLKAVISPDCKMVATTSADHTVKLWNLDDYSLDKTLVGHKQWVWDAVFSADSAYLVTGSSDNTAKLWDVSSGETIRHYTGHHKAVVCVALNDTPPDA